MALSFPQLIKFEKTKHLYFLIVGHLAEIWRFSDVNFTKHFADSLYKDWELLTKSKTNSIFKGVYIYFMAIQIEKMAI